MTKKSRLTSIHFGLSFHLLSLERSLESLSTLEQMPKCLRREGVSQDTRSNWG